MRKKLFRSLFFTLILLTCQLVNLSPFLWSQTYRDNLKVAPAQVYQVMFAYAEKKDYAKVLESISYIKPVLMTLKEKFSVDCESELKEAIGKKDIWEIQAALLKLVFYDMKDLFSEITASSKDVPFEALKYLMKQAYIDYLFISPELAKKEMKSDGLIKQLFKKAYSTLTKESPSGEKVAVDLKKFKEITTDIEDEIVGVYSYFKPPKKT